MVSARPCFLVVTGTSMDAQLRLYRAVGERHVVTALVHKGSRFYFNKVRRHASFPARALVIPCERRAIDAVVEWQRMGQLVGGKAPYYFSRDMMAEPNFEPRAGGGRDFAGRLGMWDEGRIRAHAELWIRDTKNRVAMADEAPLARYNCATLATGVVAHVAGVALDAIDPDLLKATRSSSLLGWIWRNAGTATPSYAVTGDAPLPIRDLRL